MRRVRAAQYAARVRCTMSVHDTTRATLDSVLAETHPKNSVGKHYIPLSNEEWALLEKAYGKRIEPKHLKSLIFKLFNVAR